jgi:hypothetical protein
LPGPSARISNQTSSNQCTEQIWDEPPVICYIAVEAMAHLLR